MVNFKQQFLSLKVDSRRVAAVRHLSHHVLQVVKAVQEETWPMFNLRQHRNRRSDELFQELSKILSGYRVLDQVDKRRFWLKFDSISSEIAITESMTWDNKTRKFRDMERAYRREAAEVDKTEKSQGQTYLFGRSPDEMALSLMAVCCGGRTGQQPERLKLLAAIDEFCGSQSVIRTGRDSVDRQVSDIDESAVFWDRRAG